MINQTINTTATATSSNFEKSDGEKKHKKTHHKQHSKVENKKQTDKVNFNTINYNDMPVIPAKYSDSDDSEDEGMEDYKIGGYHPIHVG